jgi:hypothetical protein
MSDNMYLMRVRCIAMAGMFALGLGSRALAQCGRGGPATPASAPRVIVGLVTDESNHPLEGITITISQPKRLARTNAQGEFRIDSVEQGKYQITVRRIGFEPATTEIEVRQTGGSARICMAEEATHLAPLTTSIFRGGLSGTVSDTTYMLLPGAEVRAQAANAVSTTDSAGEFFLDLKKGEYAVVVQKKGYARQVVSVSIPADSGRKIAVWLGKADGWDNRMAEGLDNMRWRMLMTPGSRYKVLTHEAMAATSMDLEQSIRMKAVSNINPDCDVELGGSGGVSVPLWSLQKEEVEFMEIMLGSPFSKRGQTSMTAGASKPISAQVQKQPANCQVSLIAWLRK